MITCLLSRYLPPTMPLFFMTGSKMASVSSERKQESTNDLFLQISVNAHVPANPISLSPSLCGSQCCSIPSAYKK